MPLITEDSISIKACEKKLEKARSEFLDGTSVKFCITDNSAVVGDISFTNITRGPFQACNLGYKLDVDFEGKGVMHEALSIAIQYVFDELNVHRIMANYKPTNERSGNLLRSLGFNVEGYARDYLKLNGEWSDHILTSKTNQRWKENAECKVT